MYALMILLSLAGQQLDQTQGNIQRGTVARIEAAVCKVGNRDAIYSEMNKRQFTKSIDADDLFEIVENAECI